MVIELEGEKPFFSRQATKNAIAEIASADRLVIYAGAGVTIDRSSIGWKELVSGLMETYVQPQGKRNQVVQSATDLQAASIAVQLYRNDHGNRYRDRLTDRLRVTLYNSGDWQKGSLATNLANLMFVMNQRQIDESGRESPGTCIVTPNYDDYLYSEVEAVSKMRRPRWSTKRWESVPSLVFPTRGEPLSEPGKPKSSLSDWISKAEFPRAHESPCIHLHGFVPRTHSSLQTDGRAQYRHPVVSEQDYFDTASNSYESLYKLFNQSAVLIVGASMTDPPLLRALADTAREAEHLQHRRYALVTMQDHLEPVAKTELQRLLRERYVHFGVTPIFLDYFGQMPQFVDEVALAVSLSDPWTFINSEMRYGRRLVNWWRKWINAIETDDENDEDDWQWIFHDTLNIAATSLSHLLGASADEILKIELWVRWAPKTERELRLWATSVGTLSDERLLRRGNLEIDSDYKSVEALLAGRPIIKTLDDDEDVHQRWRTYISIPLRVPTGKNSAVTVAAITIASMSNKAQSALDPAKNRDKLVNGIDFVQDLGTTLVTPSPSKWSSYRDELVQVVFGAGSD